MLRSLVAVILGVVFAVVVVFAVEFAGHAAFPTPNIGTADCSDPETYADKTAAIACTAAAPFASKAAIVAGWFLGAFFGGIVSLLIGRRWAPLAWIVAATIFIFSVTNFFLFPHPVWMMAGSVFAALFGGLFAIAALGAKYERPVEKPQLDI
jgi:hypothetical protein